MSIQDILIQNKKIYEKLPEVQQKLENKRTENNKKLNIMKANIFKKVFIFCILIVI
jgi:hypothetical protein